MKNDLDISDSSSILKLMSGCLKSCIEAHGPITPEWIGSATKRLYSGLKSRAREQRMSAEVNVVRIPPEEYRAKMELAFDDAADTLRQEIQTILESFRERIGSNPHKDQSSLIRPDIEAQLLGVRYRTLDFVIGTLTGQQVLHLWIELVCPACREVVLDYPHGNPPTTVPVDAGLNCLGCGQNFYGRETELIHNLAYYL